MRITIALQDGVNVSFVDGNIVLDIDTSMTKRDLWLNQSEIWLDNGNNVIDSGYFRITNKKKLEFKKHR